MAGQVININDDNLTEKQREALELITGPARHILLRGGARSGKTWFLIRALCIRALKAPGSTHLVLRYRFNHLKASIIHGTMPDVLAKCFPGLEVRLDKTDWFHEFPNGSRIWYGGLDDKGRTEKILGQEHSTILFEEISNGISWDARNLAVTRLAQNSGLKLKAYYTANPPSQAHWSYKLWKLKQDPKTGEPLKNPEAFASLHMNAIHNAENLPPEFFEEMSEKVGKDRMRYVDGEWQPAVENALWTVDSFKTMTPPSPGDDFEMFRTSLARIVVAADPSGGAGKEGEKSDETGIIVAGRMHSGRIVILEDATVSAGPAGWARKVVEMYDKWQADRIVAEKNYGGAMVEHTIKSIRRGLPVKMVNATRGKHVRAGPVAALYDTEPGVWHLGHFPELEDQMMNFTDGGYEGDNSPDRADAAIWAVTELGLGSRAGSPTRPSGVQTLRGLF